MSALFSPEILQTAAVKGLQLQTGYLLGRERLWESAPYVINLHNSEFLQSQISFFLTSSKNLYVSLCSLLICSYFSFSCMFIHSMFIIMTYEMLNVPMAACPPMPHVCSFVTKTYSK